jgi:hypothetical protein
MRRLFQFGYNHCYITIGVTFLLTALFTPHAKKIILASDVEEYKAGKVIIRKGNIGDKLCLVIAG